MLSVTVRDAARSAKELEIVLADGMRQDNELSVIYVSGKQRYASGLARFFYLVQCLAPDCTCCPGARLPPPSAKQRRRPPKRWSGLPGHPEQRHFNM